MQATQQVSLSREQLPGAYAEALAENPLLGRIESQTRLIGWSDLDIRTLQLMVALRSNASLLQRLTELERGGVRPAPLPAVIPG